MSRAHAATLGPVPAFRERERVPQREWPVAQTVAGQKRSHGEPSPAAIRSLEELRMDEVEHRPRFLG